MTYTPPTQPPQLGETGQALADLHSTVADAIEGLESLSDRADGELALAAAAFRELHESHQQGLAEALIEMGFEPEDDGGFMGLLQKSVLAIRETFSGLDADALPDLLDGEREIVEQYTEAAAEGGHPDDVDDILTSQRDELADLIENYE